MINFIKFQFTHKSLALISGIENDKNKALEVKDDDNQFKANNEISQEKDFEIEKEISKPINEPKVEEDLKVLKKKSLKKKKPRLFSLS